MALQEKEFVVKNGLDIKNGILKLSGITHTTKQLPFSFDGNTLAWRELKSGQGIIISYPDINSILVSSSGSIPTSLSTSGNLQVGITATGAWSANGTTTVTVTHIDHGFVTGNTAQITWYCASGAKPVDGSYIVNVLTNNTFTITNSVTVAAGAVSPSCILGGNITAALSLIVGTTLTVAGSAAIGNSMTMSGSPVISSITTGNPVTLFNTTTGAVSLAQASNTINIGSSASTANFGGFVSHKGVILGAGVASTQKIDTLYSFATASIGLSTSWVDTGISGSAQLMTGLYKIKIQLAASNEYFCGYLPWFSGNSAATLLDDFTEIPLCKFGDGSTAYSIFLRIFRTASAAPKLQISATSSVSAQVYNITVRKLMD